MSANPVAPPPGYSLEDVPAFLRPTAATMNVQVQPPNGIDVARVTSTNPNTVEVNEPSQFGQPQLDHEVTHGYQFSRNPAVVSQMEGDLASGRVPTAYTYGGPQGLIQARQQGKTIADFGPEQQAEMVKDYQQGTQAAIASGDAGKLDRLNQAYGPYLQQLARLPGKNDSMTTMTQQDLTPAAPGLPPASESGIMAPSKLLGGPMKIVPPAGYTLER